MQHLRQQWWAALSSQCRGRRDAECLRTREGTMYPRRMTRLPFNSVETKMDSPSLVIGRYIRATSQVQMEPDPLQDAQAAEQSSTDR